jgi:hypothetical protein
MAILRKLVSDVRSLHKLLSTDSIATDRMIASELKVNALLLLKRETNLRRLWATDTIFTTIPCLQMIEVPISECCDYADPCNIARSKLHLPRICEGNYQYLIQGVYSINAMRGKATKLKEVTINRYINLLKLPIVKKENYYWIANDYLYVTNPMVQKVRMAALFEEDVPNELMYPECECGEAPPLDELCKNPLDKESFIPGYLEKQVLQLTSQTLLSTYFGVRMETEPLSGVDEQVAAPPQNQRGR